MVEIYVHTKRLYVPNKSRFFFVHSCSFHLPLDHTFAPFQEFPHYLPPLAYFILFYYFVFFNIIFKFDNYILKVIIFKNMDRLLMEVIIVSCWVCFICAILGQILICYIKKKDNRIIPDNP